MPLRKRNVPATFSAKSFLHKKVLIFWTSCPQFNQKSNIITITYIQGIADLGATSITNVWKRCDFGRNQLAYLWQNTSRATTEFGAMMRFSRINRLLSQVYWGICNITSPLTYQMNEDMYGWTVASQMLLWRLRQAMSQSSILSVPNFSKKICQQNRRIRFI